MLLLLSSVSLLTLAHTVVQLAGDSCCPRKLWVVVQIGGAVLLPLLSRTFAALPLVATAILVVVYCAAQGIVARMIRSYDSEEDAASTETTGALPAGV
jgi:hypothetical protein